MFIWNHALRISEVLSFGHNCPLDINIFAQQKNAIFLMFTVCCKIYFFKKTVHFNMVVIVVKKGYPILNYP